MYPTVFRRKNRRELFLLAVSLFSFFMGLIMLMEVGPTLWDHTQTLANHTYTYTYTYTEAQWQDSGNTKGPTLILKRFKSPLQTMCKNHEDLCLIPQSMAQVVSECQNLKQKLSHQVSHGMHIFKKNSYWMYFYILVIQKQVLLHCLGDCTVELLHMEEDKCIYMT